MDWKTFFLKFFRNLVIVVVAVGMWVTQSEAESYPHTHSWALRFGGVIFRILSPGMIRGRLMKFGGHGQIDIFGIDDLG